MAKAIFALFVFLAPALAGAQAVDPISGTQHPNQSAAFTRGALSCSQSQVLQIPRSVAERAKLKVRLMTLLRESLFDDTRGIVNIAREKEIKKLASKLKNGMD